MINITKLPKKIIGYRLLVELVDLRTQTEVVLPEGPQVDRTMGTVVMVGDGELPPMSLVRQMDPPAAVGDMVIMGDYGGGDVMVKDKCFRLISGDEVLAIL